MAFTKTPMQDSAQNKTVPLLYKWDSRDASAAGYDTVLKNAILEPVGEEYFHVIKRDGVETVPITGLPGTTIIGLYYWPATTNLVVVTMAPAGAGSIWNVNTTNWVASFVTTVPTLPTADIEASFVEFLYQSGAIDLIITVGSQCWKLTTAGVATAITVPGGAGAGMAFLDGYLFSYDTANIYNSNLNDPTTWSASNFLAVDSYPDRVLRMARVGPYLVAFGAESIQYFYDAANPTGTPLAANVGATKHIGYVGGIAQYGDDILFIGTQNQGTASLYRLSGLKVEAIASFPFSRMWTTQNSLYTSTAIAPPGSILNIAGHTMYYVHTATTPYSVPDVPPNIPVGASYMYDLDTGNWTKLGYKSTEFYLIKQTTIFSQQVVGQPGSPRMTYHSVLGDSLIHRFNPAIYRDDGVNFEVKLRTKPWDFGTFRNKFAGRMLLQADQTATSSLAFLSWSDDDYKTTSTPRSIDLQYAYQQLYALGSFRKRSFTLTYTDNFPMRFRNLELDYEQGTA